MNSPVEVQNSIGIHRVQSLYASVIRSCTKCGAPGYWHNTPGVNIGCYAPDKVTQLGSDPVGRICPNCGGVRVSVIENQGLLWQKLFGSPFAVWMATQRAKVRSLFK